MNASIDRWIDALRFAKVLAALFVLLKCLQHCSTSLHMLVACELYLDRYPTP